MKPPHQARRLLGWTLPAPDRTDVLENLDDLYRRRVLSRGRVRAHAWYWWQALTFGVRLRAASGGRLDRLSSAAGHRVVVRPSQGDGLLTGLASDGRLAVRGFLRSPRFATAALLTLVLGLSGTTVIWTIVYGTVLRPSDYPASDRLLWVWPSGEQSLTLAQFEDLQPLVSDAIELTAFSGRTFAVTGGSEAQEVQGVAVSRNHFDVFGLVPVLGRGFGERDSWAGAEPVAVISHALWRRQFASDPAIVGRAVDVYAAAAIPMLPGAFTGQRHTIVGVAPPDYSPFGFHVDVITPLIVDPGDPAFTNMGELLMVGRLARGVSAEVARSRVLQAVQELDRFEALHEAIAAEALIPLRDAVDGNLRPAMLLSLAGVGLVLLMACVNVANLLLVRVHGRQREFAVRRALGATPGRLARQQMAEVGVLVIGAALIAVWLARAVLPSVVALLPPGIATERIALDVVPMAIAFALILPAALLCGGIPAMGSRTSGIAGSRPGHGGVSGQAGVNRLLIVAQIALALVLAHAAGQLIANFFRLTGTPAGFSADNVVTVRTAPSSTDYRDTESRRDFYARVLERARALPDVEAAGAIHFLPIADGGPSVYFRPDAVDAETVRAASYRVITPGYIESLRIPLRRGRLFDESDRAGGAAGLINESLARELWPGEDPIGQSLYRSDGRSWFTVVGVVGDVRQSSLQAPPHPEIYLPLSQSEWASAMTIVARSASPQPTGDALRAIIRGEDPGVPITRVTTMTSILSQSVAGPRFWGLVFSVFAGIALLLGGVGVYGVTSFVVARRTDEIGVRLALGATSGDVLRRELGRGLVVVATGIAVGLVVSLVAARLLEGLLYDASPFDPVVFGVVSVIIAAVAFGAVAVPARSAARLDPLHALRCE